MAKKKRSGFFDLFGFGDMDEEFGRMREEMEEVMERMTSQLPEDRLRDFSKKGNPRVYGFSVRVGTDGKPVVREFGNVRRVPVAEAEKAKAGEGREPLVDVFRDKKSVNVVAELPGVDEKEIKVSVKGKGLEITAWHGERRYSRKVELPEKVDKRKMKKRYKNGVLELKFPL